jgi:hypothetical protein
VIAGGAAAGGISLILLFFLGWLFLRRRRRRQQYPQYDGGFEPTRIVQGSTGAPDLTGSEITPFTYESQVGEATENLYDSAGPGVGRDGSGRSGPSSPTWSGESGMRQYRDNQALLTGNVLHMRGSGGSGGGGGDGGTGTSRSDYGLTPSDSTSPKPPSSTAGRSISYSSGSGGGGISTTMASTGVQQQQKPYRTLSGTGKELDFAPSHLIDTKDGGQGQVQVVETLSSPSQTSQQRVRSGLRYDSGVHDDITVPVSIMSDSDLFMHTDGGRVPDPDVVAVNAPQEIPPSYDSIPGNM